MTRRTKVWLVLDALFILGNLVGAGFALAVGELGHAGGHAGLLVLGVYLFSWILPKPSALPADTGDLADGLTRLQQSVDAVAIEVERVGEGQRFMTGLFDPATSRTRDTGKNVGPSAGPQPVSAAREVASD